jgi:hypothetical protein
MGSFLQPTVLIPIVGILLPVFIVGIVFWFKSHEKDLQFHQEMRIREMEHQRKMKELDVELEKTKAQQGRREVA